MPGTRPLQALSSASLLLLTAAGDPTHGRDLVLRQSSTCLLCHAAPLPNPHLQGNVGPDLAGVGARLTPAELRARITDPTSQNPDTLMPAFGIIAPGARVGAAWRGKPILSPQEIEDIVAYLATLK